MSPMKLLEDALAEGRNFADLAGKLRDKFKSGTADLRAIYEEAEGVVDGAVAKARDGLAAFKAEVEKVDEDVKNAGASIPDPKVIDAAGSELRAVIANAGMVPEVAAGDVQAAGIALTVTAPSGATVTVDPAAGTTTHVDPASSVTTTLDHASGSATAVDGSVSPAQPVEPAPAAVAEARDAAAAAGVTVPAQG